MRPKLLSTELAVNLLPAVVISIIAAAIQLFPQSLQHIVRYDRVGIAEGEFWRIITGHLAHLGWNHLAMNVAGLWLVTYVFAPLGKPWLWVTGVFATALLTSAGLYFFYPQLSFYVGLSGVLLGIVVIGALQWIQEGDWMGFLVLVIVAGKIGWEQIFGALPLSQQMAGGPVVVDAHLCGTLGGLVVALWRLFRCERERS